MNIAVPDPGYWLKDMPRQGRSPFNPDPGYQVFRNVKDFGAKGDGVTDDTVAINTAMASGGRCAPGACQSSTITPAILYFPAGTYLVSGSIVMYYNTQLIGNPNSLPVLKATSNFQGFGVIDGDEYVGANEGWLSVGVFWRSARHLKIDLTAIPPATGATGIHWPTGQATSLQDIQIIMTASSASTHQGLFIEDGSGGYIGDLTITGGLYGMNIGNQQFTMRNIAISNAIVGISQIWNWGWLYSGLTISNCGTAFSMSNGGTSSQSVGSVTIIDSTITNCPAFIDTAWTPNASPATGGSLILENIVLSNVPTAIRGPNMATVLSGGTTTIAAWGQGHRYTSQGPTEWQGTFTQVTRPGSLLDGNGRYHIKSKPHYWEWTVSQVMSIRDAGAKGDGVSDDTQAIQAALNAAASAGKILYFNYGVYKVSNTIKVPAGSRIVGETYPVILASGGPWGSATNPVPVVKIGNPGESGRIEWQDMIVSTQGPAPGAVLIEWNLAASRDSGMWDVHTRIGGFQGSNQQVAQCPIQVPVSGNCMAAYMSMHITTSGTGAYLENCWFWTADHDIDDSKSTRVSVYTGRGLLVEASGVWLWGTAVEHHSLYQYQFANAHEIFAGFIQTESPYYQPAPDVHNSPYPTTQAINDPTYANCLPGNCDALGLRVLNSKNIYVYGAGLYSFFNNYSTQCSNKPTDGGTKDCQSELFSVEGSTDHFWMYGLNTIGTINMVVQDGMSLAKWSDNANDYSDTIALFTYRT
ncbi:pectin lyase-like protein [Mytilinidion resinicola]|uniref:Pectin lyase-like protein n=1 Tax=Mytilinidion resinicola TaxID=574789 RepID=A0A6A6Z111_9PEZI|nr:pectin lyase-like protein [Mytilinidion resinicola]KAF2813845.1 pectin lyase-like protein [Mytilinidion resinicola]